MSNLLRGVRRFTRQRKHLSGFERLEARALLAVDSAADFFSLDEDTVLDLAPTQTFLSEQSLWKYTTTNGDLALIDPDFDATWHTQGLAGSAYDGPPFATGSAAFEYGTVDALVFKGTIQTNIAVALHQSSNPPLPFSGLTDTAYFVTTFDFDGDPAQVTRIVANVLADDGAVFYLNGEEVGRINMGDQPDSFAARATMATVEYLFFDVDLTNQLVAGANVLAVSVHNVNFQGADMGFDMSLQVTEDRGSVLANDASDLAPPDNSLRVIDVNGQAVGDSPVAVATDHSNVTMRPDGTFRYVPAENYHGVDTVTYVAADGAGESAPTSVTLEIRAVNDRPVAVDDVYTLAEDTTFVAELPTAPTIIIPSGATWHYFDELTNGLNSPAEDYPRDTTGRLWFDPDFDVVVSDPAIGVWKSGAGPFAQGDILAFTGQTSPLSGIGETNSTDLFRTTFTLSDAQSRAETLWVRRLFDDGGILYINGNEIRRWNMPAGVIDPRTLTTTTETEQYRTDAIDVSGLLHEGENSIAFELHQFTIDTSDRGFDLELSLSNPNALGVTANDADAENDALVAQLVAPPEHGTVLLEPSGRFTYTPEPDYFGEDSFTYTVADAGTPPSTSLPATVRLTITPVADTIVALPDAFETDEDVVLTGNVLVNDSSEDLPLAATLVVPAQHGSVSLASDGTFTYMPEANFFGVDTFRYRATDAVNDFDIVTTTITVHPVNDSPTIALPPVYGVREDQPLTIAVPRAADRTIVSPGAVWEYNQSITLGTPAVPGVYPVNTAHPGVDWNDPGFSTATSTLPWLSGAGPFVAGMIDGVPSDGQFTTLINGDVNTILFRTTFDLTQAEAAAASRALLTGIIDDGGVVYVNGREALRIYTPADVPISPDTLAVDAGSETPQPFAFDIGGLVVPGANVLAFELHQGASSPADVEHLRISEIMYHPPDPTLEEHAAGFDDDNEFEFLEFVNTTGRFSIDLSGVRFTTGVTFQFTTSTLLGPRERGVLVADEAAFRARYGDGPRILGSFSDHLSNGGEQLRVTALGRVVLDFTYGDSVAPGWPIEADGFGRSLVIVNPHAPTSTWGEATQWRPSTNDGGSPSALDTGEPRPLGIDDAAFSAELSISIADGLLAGAGDVEDDALSVAILEGPAHGSLVLGADGAFTYMPDRNFFGDDAFRYVIVDDDSSNPATSEPIVATIRVVPDSDVVTCEDLDWNRNGAIDGGDLVGIAGRYGATVQPGAEADFNADGIVGLADAIRLQAAMGQSCSAMPSAPAAVVRAVAVDAALRQGNAAENRIAEVRQGRAERITSEYSASISNVGAIPVLATTATSRRLAPASGRRALRQEHADRADELI